LIDLVLRKQDIDSLQMEETPRKLIIFTFTLYLMMMLEKIRTHQTNYSIGKELKCHNSYLAIALEKISPY